MIHRTILEWETIRYGEGSDAIPSNAVDRIAAVAAASPLAGRGGGGVLEHGRKGLRARSAVGVMVADDCALEILPKIDVPGKEGEEGGIRRRLVHMLAVALDMKIDAGKVAAMDWQRATLLEILIRLFSEKLIDTVRQGMPRRYVEHAEDLPVLRGRLDATCQFTRLAAEPGRIACRYDALTANIALNHIMKAAVLHLAKIARTSDNQRRLRELAFSYADIADLPVAALRWDHVVLDRTNDRWRELLDLARMLLGESFQSTSVGCGTGFSLLFEMNTLFEAYVARMLKRALADDGLSVVSRINISMSTPSEIERGLLDGRLHVGALPHHDPDRFGIQPLYEERSSLYCSRGPRIAFLILTGEYIGFLPDHFAATWLEKGMLAALASEEMQFVVTLGVATRKARRKNLIVDRLLDVLLQNA